MSPSTAWRKLSVVRAVTSAPRRGPGGAPKPPKPPPPRDGPAPPWPNIAEQVLEVGLAGAAAGGGVADVARPGACALAEQAAEEVLEAGRAAAATGAAGGEAGAAVAHRADGVVLLALLGVGQDRVGLADLLEPLLGRGVPRLGVGVERARELAVGLLDRRGVGVVGTPRIA